MLIQLDGSHHRWLGHEDGRTVRPCSSPWTMPPATVVNALFCGQEDARNYFLLMQGLLQRCGAPVVPLR